jgi:hypothetical protein
MFFKILIIMFAISYFFPRLLRWGLKMFIGSQINKVQSEFQNQAKAKIHKEGEIKVDYSATQKGKSENMKGGEYIDYEEVKD